MFSRYTSMFDIIENQLINEQVLNIPKILPNNLTLIKQNLNISNDDIAKSLGINPNFVGNVANENVNFSGMSVVKFIKNFNIPFNLLYSVNKEVEYSETYKKSYFYILRYKNDTNLEMHQILNDVLQSADKDYTDIVFKFCKKIECDQLTYTKVERSENYSYYLDLYNEHVKKTDYDFSNYQYYAIAFELHKNLKVKKVINLQENFDLKLNDYLESKPFIELTDKIIKIPLDKLEKKGDYILLPERYKIVIGETITETDKIKEKYCKKKRKSIEITVLDQIVNLTKLKYIREFKNYTIEDMANKLCISPETYSALEKGYLLISSHLMWKIELEFGVLLSSVLNIDEYHKKYCIN